MRYLQRHAAVLVLFGLIAFIIVGCNTMEGAGEDVESAGESIQDAAD